MIQHADTLLQPDKIPCFPCILQNYRILCVFSAGNFLKHFFPVPPVRGYPV